MKERSKEFKEGWNANMLGKTIFAGPYLFGEQSEQWTKGYNKCQKRWNNPDKPEPKLYESSDIN